MLQEDFSDFDADRPSIDDSNVLSHDGYQIQLPDGQWEVVRDADRKEYYVREKGHRHPPKWVHQLMKLKRAKKQPSCNTG